MSHITATLGATDMQMRIDELSRHAGVPTRTIRYYTQQGLLHPPELQGRVGYYDDSHLDRLRLIKELQEHRYLPLSVIRSVIKRAEEGVSLDVMLGPLDRVFGPRDPGSALDLMTRTELAERAGVDESVVQAADEMGFLFPVQHDHTRKYTSDDLQMVGIVSEWIRLSLPRELAEVYRSSLQQVVALQMQAFREGVVRLMEGQKMGPEQMRGELETAYRDMARTCTRLVAMLHRKLVQKAIETAADSEPRQRLS